MVLVTLRSQNKSARREIGKMTVEFDEALTLLRSHLKLERDRGLEQLKKSLENFQESVEDSNDVIGNLKTKILGYVDPSTDSSWETKQGGLLGAKVIISARLGDENFTDKIRVLALRLTHDQEARVRQAAGEVLGALCRECGVSVYEKFSIELLKSVEENLERHIPGDETSEGQRFTDDAVPIDIGIASSLQVLHESAGWQHLETSMRCLQHVIEGCGSSFSKYVTPRLLNLLFQALDHTNRFVRETGYQVIASLVSLGTSQDAKMSPLSPEQAVENRQSILSYGSQLADYLKKGLADNWSQVRLAASWATRSFLVTLGNDDAKEQFYPKLLPPMCLNRYYVAAGVRIYSQENWKIITGIDGKRLIGKFIKETVEFYVSQTKADNHAVREAACECIAELGIKVSPDAVRPYVGVLLEAMIECFRDEGWPVRDAACLACGNFVQCFPDECKSSLDTLYELFFNNLSDNIPSVRQGAAAALANVINTYGSEAAEFVTSKARDKLKEVEKQESTDDGKFSGLEKGAGLFGVVKRQKDNNYESHSNQTMYSCGSLAPKMGRAGCLNSHFKRPSQPWEITEGCICLVAEMSKLKTTLEQVKSLIPLMAESTKHRHYSQYLQLYESVCKQLPVIAKGVGKRTFKCYLESFFDTIFHSLTCEHALTSTAAAECIQELAVFLGPSILRGRVELYNPSYLPLLDNHVRGI